MSEPSRERVVAAIRLLNSDGYIAAADILISLLALAYDEDTGEKHIERAAISEELRKEALARLAEVERERDAAYAAINLPMEPDAIRLHREKMEMFDRALAAEARLSEVEKALEPFAAIADLLGNTGRGFVYAELSDCQRARAALAEKP